MEEIDAFTFSDCEETSAVVSGGTPSCPPSSSCGLSVLDTFPVLDATVSDKPREELEPSVVHSGLTDGVNVTDCSDPSTNQRPEKRRGRKKGSTAAAKALERLLAPPVAPPAAAPVEPRSRRDICRAAGKASVDKRRATKLASETPVRETRAPEASASECQALVPIDAMRCDPRSIFQNTDAQQSLMKWQPTRPLLKQQKDIAIQPGIFQSGLSVMSKKELAKKLKCSRQVVTKRFVLMAVCVLLLRRMRAELRFKQLKTWLSLLFPDKDVEEMAFLVKYKYDEFSMRCKGKSDNATEIAVMKIVNCSVWWVALYKVADRYVRMRTQVPTVVKTIEAGDTNCMRAAIEDMTTFPKVSDGFKRKTRMPICDKHSTNFASDNSLARDFPRQTLHRFNCGSHIQHKEADRVFDVFLNEQRGMLHTCLAYNFAGTLSQIKHQLKAAVRKKGRWIDATEGPGADHDAYRQSVFNLCMDVAAGDAKVLSSGVLATFLRRKRLLNGRYRLKSLVDHFCFSRQCCRDAEHWLEQVCELIEDELGPGYWIPSKFFLVEETMDWLLFWLLCSGLLEEASEEAIGDTEAKARLKKHLSNPPGRHVDDPGEHALDEEDDDGEHDWHLPEEDLGLAEPLRDAPQEQRQSTFRKNTLCWLRSRPHGRLWCAREILRVQQTCQRLLVEFSGENWYAKEVIRRQQGKQPIYRVVKAAQGEFSKDAMARWSRMMRSEAAWENLPVEFRRHDLAVQSFRALQSALCTKYEKTVTLLRGHPYEGYLIIDDSTLGADVEEAVKLEKTYKHDPCLLDPQWFAHMEEFPTAEKALSKDSKAWARFRADEIELENLSSEAGNANIHRTIKRAFQQKLASVVDISAGSVLRFDRGVDTNLWGSKEYPPDLDATNVNEKSSQKMRGGGGGRGRAFVSHMSPLMRIDGKPDFARIMSAYKEELRKESSELLDSLKGEAKAATKARRTQHEQGKRWSMSAFGKVSNQAIRNADNQSRVQAVLDAMVEPTEAVQAAEQPAGGELVPYQGPSFETALSRVAGNNIQDQAALLRRVARHKATTRRKAAEEETVKARAALAQPKPLMGKEVALDTGEQASLRTFDTQELFDVYVHENVTSEVQSKVSEMSKSAPQVVKACEVLWKKEHNMILKRTAKEVGTIPAWAKPTYCHLYGAGMCLCKGRGLLLRLIADNLGREVCKRAPKDSTLRKYLRGSWIIFKIGRPSSVQTGLAG